MENEILTQEQIMSKYLELQEVLKTKELEIEAFKTQIEDFKTKEDNYINTVASLRDTNQKLFLKVSQSPIPEPETQSAEEKEESVASWDDIIAKL